MIKTRLEIDKKTLFALVISKPLWYNKITFREVFYIPKE